MQDLRYSYSKNCVYSLSEMQITWGRGSMVDLAVLVLTASFYCLWEGPGWEGTVPNPSPNHLQKRTKIPSPNNRQAMVPEGPQEASRWPPVPHDREST